MLQNVQTNTQATPKYLKNKTKITYRKENRIQAIQKAKELRAQGRNVALRPEKVTKVCEVEL